MHVTPRTCSRFHAHVNTGLKFMILKNELNRIVYPDPIPHLRQFGFKFPPTPKPCS